MHRRIHTLDMLKLCMNMVLRLAGRVFEPWMLPFSTAPRYRRRHGRSYPACCKKALLILGLCSVLLYAILEWIIFLPSPDLDLNLPPPFPCRDDENGYVLEEMGICTEACGKLCFPRVHGICFGHSEVTVCEGQAPIPDHIKATGGDIPPEMRFYMEKPRMKVPVKHGACPGWNSSSAQPSPHEGEEGGQEALWIHELQLVADLTAMPTGWKGPNPHHESEKLIPAILFSHQYSFLNSSLFWFADPHDPLMISKWSLGLLEIFSNDMKLQYLKPVAKNGAAPICFADAILFTRLTNSAYIPNRAAHDWFRTRLLEHCQVPMREARKPVEDAVIIQRSNDPRNFVNYEAVREIAERKLQVGVKKREAGSWQVCEQVRLVADADFLLTPHGSHNVNLLAARPGAVVMEVFPYLYYWYSGHYLHAARVLHRELHGTWPAQKSGMPFRMRLYALRYGWQRCTSIRHCMNYGKSQKVYVDLDELESLLDSLVRQCLLVVQNSTCPPPF